MAHLGEYIEQIHREQKNAIIEELEKIRQEIYDIEEPDHDFEGFYYCFEEALKIVDKELTELKGKINVYDTSCNEKRC